MKISFVILTLILLTSCQTIGQENYTDLTSKIDSIITESNFNGVILVSTDSINIYSKAIVAGGFISNARNLKKWNRLLYSGELVTKETLELMSTKYATRIHPVFEIVKYGYGLLFKDGEEKIQIGALGYAPGFVSACYFYPQTKINVIVLENTARHLNDFKRTFQIHTEIMDAAKKRTPNNGYNK